VYVDLHGGDMVEDLEPFSICQGGDSKVARRSEELARAFGLPNLLVVDRQIQPGAGTMSFPAASARGIPAFIAEAGGMGLLQPDAVDQLLAGVHRLLNYLGMTDIPVSEPEEPRVYSSFEWLNGTNAGMFYPSVAVGEQIEKGQILGTIGSLFGDVLEMIESPVAGRVIFVITSPAVKQNGLLMGIGANNE
jgi:predicted deacylase